MRVDVKRQMGKGDIASVSELLEVAAAADGHQPLGDHQWLDLVHGGREGFALAIDRGLPLIRADAGGWLAPAGLIYIERPRAVPVADPPPAWQALRRGSAGAVGYDLYEHR